MPELVSCRNCGKSISSAARECPHCKKDLRKCECLSCGETFPLSDAINNMHQQCWNKLMGRKDLKEFSCPTCKKILSYSSAGFHFTCPECGQPIYFEQCFICKRLVASDEAFRFCPKGTPDNPTSYLYFHKSCNEIEVNDRIRKGLCIKCGSILPKTVWRNLLGSKKCDWCS